MTEKIIRIEKINPSVFFGTSNQNMVLLKKHFPKLKITSRGDEIKANGAKEEIEEFEKKLGLLIAQLLNNPNITEGEVEGILQNNFEPTDSQNYFNSDVLVYGNKGKIIKPRTENQKALVQAVENNDIVFAIGPAGTGKTYTGVALAVRALKRKEIKKIILARPAVEAGESLGFLPGDLKEKIDPYLKPLYDSLLDMIPTDKYNKYIENGTLEVIPLAFMRGRTLDNCFVILDEAQNATSVQLKMFLTRMGPNAKMIINGDLSQIDLPKHQQSGLRKAIDILKDIKGVSIVELTVLDVVRHKLVKEIIKAYDRHAG
ncbi:MAG: PhoH family protein [Flavobacteriales bacterium]|nr:PhoH family protein [Flavobacteriales bacterium]